MNRAMALSLQRQALCLRLQAQRRTLQLQAHAAEPRSDDEYPRSFTMRLLTQQPSLTLMLATEVLPLLLNRFLRKPAERKRQW